MVSFRGAMATGLVLLSAMAGTSCSGDDGQKSDGDPDGGTGAGGAEAGAGAGGALPAAGGQAAGGASSGGAPDGGLGGGGPDGAADAQADTAAPPSLNCGDGTVQASEGEECDEGRATNGTPESGCNPACRWVCIQGTREGICNNGSFCDGAESCGADHRCLPSAGNLPNGTRCGQSHTCIDGVCRLVDAICGDGFIRPGDEECEDGNDIDGDGCDSCRFSCVLGDATRDCRPADPCQGASRCEPFSHTCEPRTPLADLTPCGTATDDTKCVAGECTTRYCGNGTVDAPREECDDGNNIDGDGCDDCKYSCLATDPTRDCSAKNDCYEDGTCSARHICSDPLQKAAGSPCGASGNYCMQGSCIAPVCGDGVKGPAEACDDANINDQDGCRRTCAIECTNAATDCVKAGGQPDAPACRVPVCVNERCDSTAGPDGASCNTGSLTATCTAGACTTGTCGNGTQETGEQCDRGSGNGPNTGCEVDCRLSCQVNADCTDGDPCNGSETCNVATNRCTPGTPQANGTGCGGGRICIRGGCARSACGDNYWNEAGGEGCDPPNTAGCDAQCRALEVCDLDGGWALRVDAAVTWGSDNPGIQTGASTISQWALMDLTRTGTSLAASLAPCAITVPDFEFHLEGVIDHEWYGLSFDSSFAQVAPATTTGRLNNLSPGALVTLNPTASLIGLAMPNPFDPTWPDTVWDLIDVPGVTFPDVDQDGNPGITVSVKAGTRPANGATYRTVPVNLTNLPEVGRADQLSAVVRQIASQAGTLDTCTTMSGTASVTSLNVHIAGCRRDTGVACVDDEVHVADSARPIYTVTGATFRAVKLTGMPSCEAVKGALP